jgi:glycosyltransferase involved in cell wall biosynthesis
MGQIGRLIERWLFKAFYRGRNWVVVSQSTRDELTKLRLDADSVSIVTNGADHIEGRKSAVRSDRPTALVVSRLRRYKSVGVVIRAWKEVEFRLPEAAYRGLIADLNLKNVRILGHVSPSRREELMSTSWATLQPSLKEGWGLTVMEAARFATPSIASDVPGLRDSIVTDETGVLVPHGEPAAWSEAILELLTNPERCELLGRNARARSDRYTWESAGDAFAEAIRAATAPET